MNKELARTIGAATRHARKNLQLTQEDAAERINVSVEFYARIERGNSLPSILTFARIVTALGVSADALLGRGPIVAHALGMGNWGAPPPSDSPEMRRVIRRLRKASPSTLRLVNMLAKELERIPPANETDEGKPAKPSRKRKARRKQE
jgi:transcriptional regulator with XRE-family HTH domain